MSRNLGIYLGTAKACAAMSDGRTVQIVPQAEGAGIKPWVWAHQLSYRTSLIGHTAGSETGPYREPASLASRIACRFWERAA